MNKVITIRLGNYVLTIDEDAAQVVASYTDSLKRRYAGEDGAGEIVSDIEERMGELLEKKQKEQRRNYTTTEDVEAVIAQMGPIEGEGDANSAETFQVRRRLFRDTDNRIVGGVWSGVAAYFDIDPIIPRLFGLVTSLFMGFGIPLYIVLWIIIPEARTRAEKLMMHGRKPNLKNFEDNVKQELNNVGRAFSNNNNRSQVASFFRGLADILVSVVTVMAKVAVSLAGAALLMVLIAVLAGVSTNSIYFHEDNVVLNGQAGLNTILSAAGDPMWIKIGLVVFILLMIAWIGLIVFSNRNNRARIQMPRRYLGWSAVIMLLILFVFAFDGIRSIGTKSQRTAYSEPLNVEGDTLYLQAAVIDTDKHGFYTLNSFQDVLPSPDDRFRIEQINYSFGHNRISSSMRNEHMGRQYSFSSNSLSLTQGNRVNNLQKDGFGWVEYILYVPRGKTVKIGSDFHFPENNNTGLWEKDRAYTMDTTGYLLGETGSLNAVYPENDIDRIEIDGKFDVQIIPALKNRIELVSGPILRNRDWLETEGSEIRLEADDIWLNQRTSTVRIYVRRLNSISLAGVAQANFQHWQGNKLSIEASGATEFSGNLNLETAEIEMDGTAHSDLRGNVRTLYLNADGASRFGGSDLTTSKAVLETGGASHASLWVKDELEGRAGGASSVEVRGNPTRSDMKTSGAARFHKL